MDDIDEDFLKQSKCQVVNSSAQEAAAFLENLLRSKASQPDDIENDLYTSFLFLVRSDVDVIQMAGDILLSLHQNNAPPIISKRLIKALLTLHENKKITGDLHDHPTARLWREIDPQGLKVFAQLFDLNIPQEE